MTSSFPKALMPVMMRAGNQPVQRAWETLRNTAAYASSAVASNGSFAGLEAVWLSGIHSQRDSSARNNASSRLAVESRMTIGLRVGTWNAKYFAATTSPVMAMAMTYSR